MLIFRREFVLENIYYRRAISECAKSHGKLIKVVGKNVVSVRRRGEILIEIIRGNRSLRLFRMLIPVIKGDIKLFKRRENGDIYFRIGI